MSLSSIIGQASRGADLYFVFRFLRLLTMDYKKTDAYKFGIIDNKGNALRKSADLESTKEKAAYTMLHRMVFKIRRLIEKVPGGRFISYAAALFLLKDTFKESVDDPDVFEKEFMKYLKEEGYEIDDSISEEVIGFGEVLPKGEYVLVNDILNKEEEELSAKKGDKVVTFEDEAPIDTILGIEIFPVVHMRTKEIIYVSLEDIKEWKPNGKLYPPILE